jgi:hypothetical protein
MIARYKTTRYVTVRITTEWDMIARYKTTRYVTVQNYNTAMALNGYRKTQLQNGKVQKTVRM